MLGPLLLGRLFDTIGRRPMIAFTYLMSGLLLALTGWLFAQGMLTAREQTMAWSVIFFFASAAASSAYLTVSETFPLEIRALAIAVFYAVGTGVGGVVGPMLFGALIDTGSRTSLFGGYLLGAALMVAAAAVMWRWGVAAERKPLEQVARPLALRWISRVPGGHARRLADAACPKAVERAGTSSMRCPNCHPTIPRPRLLGHYMLTEAPAPAVQGRSSPASRRSRAPHLALIRPGLLTRRGSMAGGLIRPDRRGQWLP